jgi:hypothetical protein
MARGWIRTSAAYSVKTGQGDERGTAHGTLGEGLGVTGQDGFYMIFRELGSGLEYIRSSKEIAERGLYFEVGAYNTRVFWEFREVRDNEWRQYGYLADYLNGQGVPSIEEALRETFLQPVHYPFRELVNAGMFRYIIESRPAAADSIIGAEREPRPEVDEDDKMAMLDEVESKMLRLLQEVKRFAGGDGDEEAVAREVRSELEALLQLTSRASDQPVARVQPEELAAREYLRRALLADPGVWDNLLGWLFTHSLGKVITTDGWEDASRSGIDEWLLGKILAGTYRDLHLDETIAWRTVRLVKVLVAQQGCFEETAVEEKQAYRIAEELLRDDDAHQFLGVNRYQGALYFNREAFDQLLERLLMITAITSDARVDVTDVADEQAPTVDDRKMAATEPTAAERIIAAYEVVQQLQQAAADAEYKVENLLNAAKGSLPSVAS